MKTGFVNDWIRRSKNSPFNPGGEKEELFLKYCKLVENGEIIPDETDSYVVVDDFYVNGDFRERDGEDDLSWSEICENAIIYDSDIALVACPGLV